MTDVEVAWVAGLIEGEGCISTFGKKRRYYWNVRVGMTDLDTIRKLRGITGMGIIYTQKVTGNRKPAWRWSVNRQAEVRELLTKILPHMGARRTEKIHEALHQIEGVSGWQ